MRDGAYTLVRGLVAWCCLLRPCVAAAAEGEAAASQPALERAPPRAVTGRAAWSRGELGAQANELAHAWSKHASVRRLKPRLLERGELHSVWVAEEWLDPAADDCVTVAALTLPSLSFLLLFQDEALDPGRRVWPLPSAAGLSEVTRCGANKPHLGLLAAQMRSRRGLMEFVVARSVGPPRPAAELLRGRHGGSAAPSPQVGKRPPLAPLEVRLASSTNELRRRGAQRIERSSVKADGSGQGSLLIHLPTGCHRIEVMGDAHPQAPPDIDASLSAVGDDRPITSDEEPVGQATLIHCVGRSAGFRLNLWGAPPRSEVVVLRAHWALPDALPNSWGPTARANLARALLVAGTPVLRESPSFATLGVRGSTTLVVPLNPTSCQVIAVAPLRGEAYRLSLHATWGASVRHSQGSTGLHGNALSVCALGSNSIQLEVQAMGDSLAWILGVWPVASLGRSTR